jgi:hypothetical protein
MYVSKSLSIIFYDFVFPGAFLCLFNTNIVDYSNKILYTLLLIEGMMVNFVDSLII